MERKSFEQPSCFPVELVYYASLSQKTLILARTWVFWEKRKRRKVLSFDAILLILQHFLLELLFLR